MSILRYMKEEFQVIKERDPAIKSPMEVLLYPTFHVMLSYRRAHKLYLKGHYFWARFISQRAARKTGIEIHPGATIGKGFFIDHGSGVIIGETSIIGDNAVSGRDTWRYRQGDRKASSDDREQCHDQCRGEDYRFFYGWG
jgi:serine O-acetyltransferase